MVITASARTKLAIVAAAAASSSVLTALPARAVAQSPIPQLGNVPVGKVDICRRGDGRGHDGLFWHVVRYDAQGREVADEPTPVPCFEEGEIEDAEGSVPPPVAAAAAASAREQAQAHHRRARHRRHRHHH